MKKFHNTKAEFKKFVANKNRVFDKSKTLHQTYFNQLPIDAVVEIESNAHSIANV